jgi:hypothetical protein
VSSGGGPVDEESTVEVQTTGEAATTGVRIDLVRSPEVARLRSRLAARAYLYDDPAAYLAGVDEVLAALPRLAAQGHRARTA